MRYYPGEPMDKSAGVEDSVDATIFIPKKYTRSNTNRISARDFII